MLRRASEVERFATPAPDCSALTVAVLMGGRSSEREVSLESGRGIGAALRGEMSRELGPRLPESVIEVEIERDGRWRIGDERWDACSALTHLAHVDVFFIALHGGEGEDGTLQGFLDIAGRRYTGSGVRASALAMDKRATRGLGASAGMRVANGVCISKSEWGSGKSALLMRVRELGAKGWVLKPRCGGSSVATFVVRELSELEAAAERVFATRDDLLVEARVEGVELSCGVLGNHDGELFALTPIEIAPAEGRFFDYEQKYSATGARELCPPSSVGELACERVRELAARVHRAAGCDGYSRTDFILPADGDAVLLEINTLPGMTARSLLPQEAAVHGIDYTSLCLRILDLALRRVRA